MRIRSARADDFEICLNLDASYDTESAWQMEEQYCDGEWRITFREVSLPRTQHVAPLRRAAEQLEVWEQCDGFWVAVERRKVRGYVALSLEPVHRQARITDLVVAPTHRR
ncbi:MAG: GNAT family N-acetyltransferase, partial [Anaerolineae bacterium]